MGITPSTIKKKSLKNKKSMKIIFLTYFVAFSAAWGIYPTDIFQPFIPQPTELGTQPPGSLESYIRELQYKVKLLEYRTDKNERDIADIKDQTFGDKIFNNNFVNEVYFKYQAPVSVDAFKHGMELKFPRKVSGNAGGYFDDWNSEFTAPVNGTYNFRLRTSANIVDNSQPLIYSKYSIRMRVNGITKHYFDLREQSTTQDNHEVSVDLEPNDKVTFYINFFIQVQYTC